MQGQTDRWTEGQTDRQMITIGLLHLQWWGPKSVAWCYASILNVSRHHSLAAIYATQEAQRATYRAPEYDMPTFWRIGQGGQFCLLIGQKNTNFQEDVEILLPFRFGWIPLSGFRGEVQNVSANQRPWWPSCFSDPPIKKQTSKRTLRSCILSSFIEFPSMVSEEKSKLSQPIRGQDGQLVIPISPKNMNLVEDIEILLPVKFRWILFSRFNGEVNKRPKGPHIVHLSTMCHLFEESAKADIFVYWSARKIQTRKRTLRSCFLSSFIEFCSAVSEEKLKMSQPIRGQGSHLVFPIGPKNTNFLEEVEILLPVKFCWIPFSGFRGEDENVSVNQRPGRPSCFSDRPEKHKLGRRRWDLASYEVLLNSVQRFQRRSRKCLSQSEARAAILFFQSARKTQTW